MRAYNPSPFANAFGSTRKKPMTAKQKAIVAFLCIGFAIFCNFNIAYVNLPSSYSDTFKTAYDEKCVDYAKENSYIELLVSLPEWLARHESFDVDGKTPLEARDLTFSGFTPWWKYSSKFDTDLEYSDERIEKAAKSYFSDSKKIYALADLKKLDKWVSSLPDKNLFKIEDGVNNPTAIVVNGYALSLYVDGVLNLLNAKTRKAVYSNGRGRYKSYASTVSYRTEFLMTGAERIRYAANLYRWLQALGVQYKVLTPSYALFFLENVRDLRLNFIGKFITSINDGKSFTRDERIELRRLRKFMSFEDSIEDILKLREHIISVQASGRVIKNEDDKDISGLEQRIRYKISNHLPHYMTLYMQEYKKYNKKNIAKLNRDIIPTVSKVCAFGENSSSLASASSYYKFLSVAFNSYYFKARALEEISKIFSEFQSERSLFESTMMFRRYSKVLENLTNR